MNFLSDMAQKVNPSHGDPFGDINISLVVKAGIMRMDESSVFPPFGLVAQAKVACQYLFAPVGIVPQVGQYLIILVQQGDSRVEVGHDHDCAVGVDICGEQHLVKTTRIVTFSIEILKTGIGPVTNH